MLALFYKLIKIRRANPTGYSEVIHPHCQRKKKIVLDLYGSALLHGGKSFQLQAGSVMTVIKQKEAGRVGRYLVETLHGLEGGLFVLTETAELELAKAEDERVLAT